MNTAQRRRAAAGHQGFQQGEQQTTGQLGGSRAAPQPTANLNERLGVSLSTAMGFAGNIQQWIQTHQPNTGSNAVGNAPLASGGTLAMNVTHAEQLAQQLQQAYEQLQQIA